MPIFKKKLVEEKFWESILAVGLASESSDELFQVDFPIDTAKEDGATEAEIPIVSEAQVDQSAQREYNMSTTAPVEYVDGTTREYINFLCKTVRYCMPGISGAGDALGR